MKKKYNALSFLILLVLFSGRAFAQEKIDASFEQKEDKIYIYYQLKGDWQKDYEIEKVVLKRKNDPSFQLNPSDLSGNIGKGKFAAGRQTIVWSVDEDEQNILAELSNANDFFIEITASEVKGGSTWYYYVGGAALLGGGAALLLGKKGSSTETTSTNFPTPPGRP
jgi:hypothetical protein